ncbi:hypothetical protein E2K99_10275 [Herbaspirillum huttiense]|uniref:hypothetical protein n=1 Tax=Herbaspirillum huttiense TaxID=863372 RepID=UPI001064C248|nr:hypothetical protein [Herbaspirillum huttiense]QBP75373.1 hypothetical protein E2K99_10275 [Herbaspirillum huttiense]
MNAIYRIVFADGSWIKAELRSTTDEQALREAKIFFGFDAACVEKLPDTDKAVIAYKTREAARLEGAQAYRDWVSGLAHTTDNPYCAEDPRHQGFEAGMLAAQEDHQSALAA